MANGFRDREARALHGETVILVDAKNRATGVGEKLFVHRRGLRHRAFSIFIFDRNCNVIIQKRSAQKYHSAGLWSNSCCGHPRPGEATRAAAERRLFEELGIECRLSHAFSATYSADVGNELRENEIVYVFSGLHDGKLAPDRREVEDIDRLPLDKLVRDVMIGPTRYTAWMNYYVKHHLHDLFSLQTLLQSRSSQALNVRPASIARSKRSTR